MLYLTNLPFCIILILKCYFGFKWIFVHKRSRQAFLPYYRTSMTFNAGVAIFVLELTFISIGGSRYSNFSIDTIIYLLWYVFECIAIEIYLRHLDSVLFAKNNLKRDKAIIQCYLNAQNQNKQLARSQTYFDPDENFSDKLDGKLLPRRSSRSQELLPQ